MCETKRPLCLKFGIRMFCRQRITTYEPSRMLSSFPTKLQITMSILLISFSDLAIVLRSCPIDYLRANSFNIMILINFFANKVAQFFLIML